MAEDFGKGEEIWGRSSLKEGRDVTMVVMVVVVVVVVVVVGGTVEGLGSVADGSQHITMLYFPVP